MGLAETTEGSERVEAEGGEAEEARRELVGWTGADV
jgi:hypothetical protein